MKLAPQLSKIVFFLFLVLIGFTSNAQKVTWLSWSEAAELAKTDATPKKIFVDVYTDWCGWCKKMDKDTFQNAEVASYMQEKFYMVKLNGEYKKNIEYKGKTFKYVPSGRRGYHEFAATLLKGKMSYPTTVFLNEKTDVLSPVPGYHTAAPFLNIAKYFGDNIYLEKDWNTYISKPR